MINAEDLIDAVLSGSSEEAIITEFVRTARRPRKRRFGGRGAGVNPLTGKRKDPRKRRIARMAARRGRAKRRASARKFHRSARGKAFHRKLGKLVARMRRR